MYKLGEIRTSDELSYGNKLRTVKYIWSACIGCGKERWSLLTKNKPLFSYCRSCAAKRQIRGRGEKAHRWAGGRRKNTHGYITVWLPPDNFFHPMTKKGNIVLEHRLVMAKHLGVSIGQGESLAIFPPMML